jgi:hypothetical protein
LGAQQGGCAGHLHNTFLAVDYCVARVHCTTPLLLCQVLFGRLDMEGQRFVQRALLEVDVLAQGLFNPFLVAWCGRCRGAWEVWGVWEAEAWEPWEGWELGGVGCLSPPAPMYPGHGMWSSASMKATHEPCNQPQSCMSGPARTTARECRPELSSPEMVAMTLSRLSHKASRGHGVDGRKKPCPAW